jgi:hypothetical protein
MSYRLTPMAVNSSERSPQEKRERVQLFLARYHGLTSSIVEDSIIPSRLAESIDGAHPGISLAHGYVQDSLNTGDHDERLATSSLAGAQFDPKERGYLYNMNRYYAAKKNDPADTERRAKWAARALRWANVIVGSISSELDKVKGIEFIKEGGEVLLNAVEEFIASEDVNDEDVSPPREPPPPSAEADDEGVQIPAESPKQAAETRAARRPGKEGAGRRRKGR